MATSRSCDWVVATAASAWSIAARSTPCAAAAASSPGRATGAITATCAAVTAPSPNAAATAGRCSSARPVATSFVAAPPDSRACPHSHDVMLFLPSNSAASASSHCRTVRATSAASLFWACSRSLSLSSSCGPNIAGRSSAARASRVEPSSPMTPPAPRPYPCSNDTVFRNRSHRISAAQRPVHRCGEELAFAAVKQSAAAALPGVPVVELEQLVHSGEVESCGVELPADPLEHLVVLGVRRVGQDLEEVLVAGDAAAVLGRTGARTVDAVRGPRTDRGEPLPDPDVVVPAVAEVVRVAPLAGYRGRVPDGEGRLVAELAREVLDVAVEDAAHVEQVQVVVLPAHRRLQHRVQLAQGQRGGDDEPPPDRGLGVPQDHGELDRLIRSRGKRGRRRPDPVPAEPSARASCTAPAVVGASSLNLRAIRPS